MASDPLPFNLHDQLEPLECNSRQTRRGSASPQSAHTSSSIPAFQDSPGSMQPLFEEKTNP